MNDTLPQDEIRRLLLLMREQGVKKLKLGLAFEAELGPLPLKDEPRRVPLADEEKMPSEDQLLFWSAGNLPETEAQAPQEA